MMTYQMKTLIQIAISQYERMNKIVGEVVAYHNPNERVELYISYPKKLAIKNDFYWDIPEYTNGSTRKARCLFLLGPMNTGDGMYAYRGNRSEIEERLKNSEREKLLIKEVIDGNLIEIIWSYDIAEPTKEGQYYYVVDYFWFGIRLNGQVVNKVKNIKDLEIPTLTPKL